MTQKPYGNKADVYSFALVMWELVTNKLPFEDLDQMGLLWKVGVQGERPNLPAPDSRCPSELIELIKMCWNQDPTKRPQFEEIIKAFEVLENKFIPTKTEPQTTPIFQEQPSTLLISSQSTCRICFERPKQVLFEPCNHIACCLDCSNKMTACPICRQGISSKRQVFLS